MKDGWHILKGYEVYVENNMVMYGIKEGHNGESVTAYPYRCNTTYGGCDKIIHHPSDGLCGVPQFCRIKPFFGLEGKL